MTTKIHADTGIEFPDSTVQGTAAFNVPSGAVMDFAMATAPAGWLVCDGAAIPRSTYAALFAVIGITWGAGDGSTTFNLPDMRGYFRRGAGTNGDGTTAGAFATKVADANKSHNHTGNTGGQSVSHSHAFGLAITAGVVDTGIAANRSDGNNNNGTVHTGGASADHTHPFTTAASGGSETLPKNIPVLTCIKV